MWNNVRDAFPSELRSMYQSLRAEGLISYEEVERRFEEHQHTWPEAIFNEDAYFKYVKPFIDDGEDNLAMCLGSKEQQRKWWLYNRFRYIDSKYNSGNALSSYIQARVYHKSDLDVTPYADIYASAYFDSNLVQARAERNTVTTVESPEAWDPGGADAVLRIYSADQIKSLGDMSQFYVGDISFAAATKLQEVKLGDDDANYSNEHLVNVGFGNNTLLNSIDIRNCPNLTQMIDVSGCTGLETVHLEGTNVAGIHLADASAITELYLPASITNLTLKNQSKLEFLDIPDVSNVETLWVEGNYVNEAVDMVSQIANSNRKIRLVGFNKTFTNDNFNSWWELISSSLGLNDSGINTPYAYLSGEITVPQLKRGIKQQIENHYPFLTVNYTTLGDYDYQMYLTGSTNLKTFANSDITYIRSYAFYGMPLAGMTTINCPNVTKIANDGIRGMRNLTNLVLGELTYVGSYAFTDCLYGDSAGNQNIPYWLDDFIDFSTITSCHHRAFNAVPIRELRLPNVTDPTFGGVTSEFFRCDASWTGNNYALIDLPFIADSCLTTSAFAGVRNLTAIIIRQATMVNFANHSGHFGTTPIRQSGFYDQVGQGYIYVRRSLVDSYKADWANKSNLASLVDYIRAIEDYPEICDPS